MIDLNNGLHFAHCPSCQSPYTSWNLNLGNNRCQSCTLERTTILGNEYPETIKVLIDLYTLFLDNWASFNNNVRDGVAILHEANTLGWELDYVRDKWTEDLELIPGHVIAREI